MVPARTAPRWFPWPMRKGLAVAQLFRRVDDEGPVPILPDTDLRLRITLPAAPGATPVVIEKRLGTDPEFVLLDEGTEVTRGFFTFQPSAELLDLLPIEPQATYVFRVEDGGFGAILAEGVIDMSPAEPVA